MLQFSFRIHSMKRILAIAYFNAKKLIERHKKGSKKFFTYL